jgi:nucleotide-binding universal stress UspA family protein
MKPSPSSKAKTPPRAKGDVADQAGPTHASAPGADPVVAVFRLRRILVPVDFSGTSLKALQYAVKFAQQFGAVLELVHVIEPIVYPVELGYMALAQEDEQRRLDQLTDKLEDLARSLKLEPRAESQVLTGAPWKVLVEEAKTRRVDLLIISTHGYTGFKHVLMGSVAERVVRHAPCPVLVVRETEHEFV